MFDIILIESNNLLFFFPEIVLILYLSYAFPSTASFVRAVKSDGKASDLYIQKALAKYTMVTNSDCLLSLFISFAIIFIFKGFYNLQAQSVLLFNSLYINDYNLLLKFVCAFFTFSVLSLLFKYINDMIITKPEYPLFILLVCLGMFFVLSSQNLIVLYLSLEFLTMSSYILMSMDSFSFRELEGTLKYYITGILTSLCYVLSVLFFYGCFGSLNIDVISYNIHEFQSSSLYFKIFSTLGFSFVLIGFFIKLGAFPFHFWILDAYEGVSLPVALYLSSSVKLAIGGSLVYIVYSLGSVFFLLVSFFCSIFAVCSMALGCKGMIKQNTLKRFLAYSSITHVGVILLGISCFSFIGFQSTISYLYAYGLSTIVVFGCIICCYDGVNKLYLNYINNIRYFISNKPWLAFSLTLAVASLAGIPPTLGFFAKFFVFISPVYKYNIAFVFLFILLTLISTYGYLKLIKITFFEEFEKEISPFFSDNFGFNYIAMYGLYANVFNMICFTFFIGYFDKITLGQIITLYFY